MNPKLVLAEILAEAVRDVWDGRRDLFALAALPVLALSIFAAVMNLILGPVIFAMPMEGAGDEVVTPMMASAVIFHVVAFAFAQLVLVALFAVAWHRRYLVPGEKPTVLHAVQWEPRKLRYLLRLIGIMVIALAFSIAPGAVLAGILGNQILAVAVSFAVGLTMIGRLFLALPATAVDQDASFGHAWTIGKGGTFQLMGMTVIPTAVTNLGGLLITSPLAAILAGFGAAESVTGAFLVNLVAGAVSFAGYAVMTTAYSIAWIRLSNQPS